MNTKNNVAFYKLSGETTEENLCSIPCEIINISQCASSQSYSSTGFPNFFNQTSQTAAGEIANNIDIAEAVNCYDHSREFLCALLLPECRENEGLVLPNRQMCKEFYDGCGDILVETGNEELILDCETFSENPEPVCYAQALISSTEESTTIESTTMESTTVEPTTTESESSEYLQQFYIVNDKKLVFVTLVLSCSETYHYYKIQECWVHMKLSHLLRK